MSDVLRRILPRVSPNTHALEFGVYQGDTLRLIAEHMPVTGFDSYEGLPEDWREGFPKGKFACEPPDDLPANTTLIVGRYEDTLPAFDFFGRVDLVHIDCDLYSSTVTVLQHIRPCLGWGTYVVFDEFHGYPGASARNGEWRAWNEFVVRTKIRYQIADIGPEQLAVRII